MQMQSTTHRFSAADAARGAVHQQVAVLPGADGHGPGQEGGAHPLPPVAAHERVEGRAGGKLQGGGARLRVCVCVCVPVCVCVCVQVSVCVCACVSGGMRGWRLSVAGGLKGPVPTHSSSSSSSSSAPAPWPPLTADCDGGKRMGRAAAP